MVHNHNRNPLGFREWDFLWHGSVSWARLAGTSNLPVSQSYNPCSWYRLGCSLHSVDGGSVDAEVGLDGAHPLVIQC